MARYLSIAILGLAAAISASIMPQILDFVVSLLGNITPVLDNTRGQLGLVMLFVICWSIRSDLSDSLFWAFVGGLMLDMLSILPLGTTSAAFIVIVFVANGIVRQLFRVRVLFLVAITPIATIFLTTYTLLALALLGYSYDFPSVIRLILIPSMIYNLIAVIPVYAVVRLIQRRLEGGLQIAPQSLTQWIEARTNE